MRYGFYLPTRGQTASPEALETLATRAEEWGFSSVMIADHIVFPVTIKSKYPYTVSGAFPGQGDALEQLSLMAFVAGKTRSLRLISSVMILPYRNPVVTAKMLATIDVLSRGRVTVGVGVGWLREEFEALGAPDFDRRGAVSDEYLWVGGHSKAALRRVARLGDGWHPVGANPAVPLRPPELRALLDDLRRLTEAEGRDPSKLTISYKAPIYDSGRGVDGGAERRPFSGSQQAIADDIGTFAGLGVSELIFDFRSDSLADSLDRMARFAPLMRA
jgi:alkanesulfonate monooxygenase SsuD/methylene tetrahydromethanopterin reductase-like flavin-dependent oxidoreductase (luciferase family)